MAHRIASQPGACWPYRINFENATNASVAPFVTVQNVLAPNLDLVAFDRGYTGYALLAEVRRTGAHFRARCPRDLVLTSMETRGIYPVHRATVKVSSKFFAVRPTGRSFPPSSCRSIPTEYTT